MQYLFALVLAYVVAAPFTDLISYDLTETAWMNVLTYVYLVLAWICISVVTVVAITCIVASIKSWR